MLLRPEYWSRWMFDWTQSNIMGVFMKELSAFTVMKKTQHLI